MPQLIPIQLEDGTVIHIQAIENQPITEDTAPEGAQDPDLVKRSLVQKTAQQQLTQNFQAIQSVVRGYTLHTLKAFKHLGLAEVSEVGLKFGVSVDVRTGIPYIADGKAGCNLEITVKCQFPTQENA